MSKNIRQVRNWRAVIAIAGLAIWSASGWAAAAGNDNGAPLKVAANAPGTIRFDSCARPAYPEEELKQLHQGTVMLRLLIGEDGKVKESRVAKSSGYPALDEAALVGISKCSFNPPMVNGKPVNSWIHLQYVWTPS
ncbi:MAG: energy transducer TonB [Pseudomonadota bacterium]